MKKAVGLFFFTLLLLPAFAFAQENNLTVPAEYRASKVLDNLPQSTSFSFDFAGSFILAEKNNSAYKISKVDPRGEETVLVQRVSEPILGLSFYNGKVYVTLRGRISMVSRGHLIDVVSGLPAYGDFQNTALVFEGDKMYFGIGTATNSGIVGPDNSWLTGNPSIHDLLCYPVKLNQVNLQTDNFLTRKTGDVATVGSFQPFNTPTFSDTAPASVKCNSSIMRANSDGSGLETYAWGFHNPKGLSFDSKGNLYVLDQAMEDRGLRPVKNGKDALYAVSQHGWYGWPDFDAGAAVDNPLIKEDPNPDPAPLAAYDPGRLNNFIVNQFSSASGLAVADSEKISEVSFKSSEIRDFILAPDKIVQMKFGPDKNLYVLTDDGKHSQLYKVESISPAISAVTQKSRGVSFNWLISITITVLGSTAAYLVTRSQQKPV